MKEIEQSCFNHPWQIHHGLHRVKAMLTAAKVLNNFNEDNKMQIQGFYSCFSFFKMLEVEQDDE